MYMNMIITHRTEDDTEYEFYFSSFAALMSGAFLRKQYRIESPLSGNVVFQLVRCGIL